MSNETGYIRVSTITRSTVLGPPAALVLLPAAEAFTALVLFCKMATVLQLLSPELFALLLVTLATAHSGKGDPPAGD